MGNVRSLLSRPVKKFNVDNRAEKVISREKPFVAPMHKASKKQLEVARSVAPNFIKEQYRKDVQLDERLKDVYVKSEDPPVRIVGVISEIVQTPMYIESKKEQVQVPVVEPNPDRPLPILTRVQDDFEYGFWEPEHTSQGRCTLRTMLDFIAAYNEDPVKNSPENIATKYKLDVKDVANVLKYFRVFTVIVPDGEIDIAYVERMILPPVQKKDE